MKVLLRPLALLSLVAFAAACSSSDDGVDAGPQFDKPQIWPERVPICLNYEITLVNGFRTAPVAVSNQGREQLVIDKVEIEGDDRGHFTIQGPDRMVVETFEDAVTQVTYAPTEAGWDSASVVFTSNAENFPVFRVFVLARAVPEMLDGAVDTWDAGPKPSSAVGADGGEACPDDESRM